MNLWKSFIGTAGWRIKYKKIITDVDETCMGDTERMNIHCHHFLMAYNKSSRWPTPSCLASSWWW